VLSDQDRRTSRRRPGVEQRADARVIRFEDLDAAGRHLLGGSSSVARISMCSPTAGMEVATPGSRLQSITSRE